MKIKYKINGENRQLKKILIDFGPYPLHKDWLLKESPGSSNELQLKKENLNTGV